MNSDLSCYSNEYERCKMIESYDIEMRERENMEKKMEHTKLPWKVYRGLLRIGFRTKIIEIQDLAGAPIVCWTGFDGGDLPGKTKKANAEFIVSACNCHDDLLEACKSVLSYLPANDGKRTGEPDGDVQLFICNQLKSAIQKAEA